MHSLRIATLVLVIGCGSSEPSPDAPAGLVGLGQICGLGTDPCPSDTPRCLLTEGGTSFNGFCSKTCIDNGTFMTDADAKPQNVTPPLSSGDGACTAIYAGTIGTGACVATVDVMPALPLQPNTSYTFKAACVVKCAADGACPTGLACNAQKYCQAP
jgi:hypothetical protein